MKIQPMLSHLFPRRKNVVFTLFFALLFSFSIAVPNVQADPSCDAACQTDGGFAGEGKLLSSGASYVGEKISDGLKVIASGIITLEAVIANGAAIIFVLVLDPEFFLAFMNAPAIYEIWKIVRDTANMLFILMLLFSAFATIYQIDKYKYNKVLLNVIIMALLVNFSWPIARTIIDFFNSMMYFFVHSMFNTSGKQAADGMLSVMNFKDIMLPQGEASDWPHLLVAILVMGIFAITLLRLALFMLIRLVTLPILVMVSPIGFAGMSTPMTQKYAKQWWDALFKYASYGPIVVFHVLAALKILKNVQ